MTTRTDEVIKNLRTLVLDGTISPGSHLHEEVLAQKLGVSRTPIRDALRVLANENLLIYSPNRGYVVRRFGIGDILDAYDIRGTLEGMGSRLAGERGVTAAQRAELEQIADRSQAILNGSAWNAAEKQEWLSLNSRFHLAIVEASGNPALLHMAGQMRRLPRLYEPRLDPDHDVFQSIYTLARCRESQREHGEVLDAILNRQGTRAESLMREHVYRNREAVRNSVALATNGKAIEPEAA